MTTAVTNFGNVVTTGTLWNKGVVGIGVIAPDTDYQFHVYGQTFLEGLTGIGAEPDADYILSTQGDTRSGGDILPDSNTRNFGAPTTSWANGYFSNLLTSSATSNIGSSSNVWNNGFFNNLYFSNLIPSAGFTWTNMATSQNANASNARYYIDPFNIIHFTGSVSTSSSSSYSTAYFGWPNHFSTDTLNNRHYPIFNQTNGNIGVFTAGHVSSGVNNYTILYISLVPDDVARTWYLDGLSFPLF